MREEELIKKLERVELPQIELQSHRRRLRMALLNAGYLQRQRQVAILDLAKSKVIGGIDTMIRGLVSRQPVWKTAVIGILALALITGLAITLPRLTGQSAEALAADIAENSPQVRAALNGEPIVEVKIIGADGDEVRVLCQGEEGRLALANVNLAVKKVTYVQKIKFPEFSDEEKARAIEIAKADPKVQELLDKGGTIDKVISLPIGDDGYGPISLKIGEEGAIAVEGDMLPAVVIVLDNQKWMVLVDIDKGEVDRILEPKSMAGVTASIVAGATTSIEKELKQIKLEGLAIPPITEATKGEAINIAKADPRVQELLDKGAEIVMVGGRFSGRMVESEDGKTITLTSITRDRVEVILELPGEELLTVIEVDLAEGKVVSITPEP